MGLCGDVGRGLIGGMFKLMMVLADEVLTMLLRLDSVSSISTDNLLGLRLLRSTNVPECRFWGAGERDLFPPLDCIAMASSSGVPPLARLDEDAAEMLLMVDPGRERV